MLNVLFANTAILKMNPDKEKMRRIDLFGSVSLNV